MPSDDELIRKNERPATVDVNKTWWLINVLLLLFAGLIGAFIVATGDFHTQDIYKSGIIRLGVLVAIVVGMSLSSLLLYGRAQRSMQLAVLFSLVVHLSFCLASYFTYLDKAGKELVKVPPSSERKRSIPRPEYTVRDSDLVRAAEKLKHVLDTDTPDSNQTQLDRTEAVVAKAEKSSLDDPEASQLPSPVELERAEITAPRRSEELSGPQVSRNDLSRRELADQRVPQTPADVPKVKPQSERDHLSDALPTPLSRQTEPAPLERPAMSDEPFVQSAPLPQPPLTLPQRRISETVADRGPSEDRLAALDRSRRGLADVPQIQRPQVAVPLVRENVDGPQPADISAAPTEMARRDTAATAAMQSAAAGAGAPERATVPTPLELASRSAPRRVANDRLAESAGQSQPTKIGRATTRGGAPGADGHGDGGLAGEQINTAANTFGPIPAATESGDPMSRGLAPAAATLARGQQQRPGSRSAGETGSSGPAGDTAPGARQLASTRAGQPRRINLPAGIGVGVGGSGGAGGNAVRLSRSSTAVPSGTMGGGGTGGGGAIEVPDVPGPASVAGSSGGSNGNSGGGGNGTVAGGSGAFDPQPAAAAGAGTRHGNGGLPSGALSRGPGFGENGLGPGGSGQGGYGQSGFGGSGIGLSGSGQAGSGQAGTGGTGRGGSGTGSRSSVASGIGAPRRIESAAGGAGAGAYSGVGTQSLSRSSMGAGNGLSGVETGEVPLPGVQGPQPFAQSGTGAAGSTSSGGPRGELQPSIGATGSGRGASSTGSGQLASASSSRNPSGGSLPVRIAAPEGPGGLSQQPTADLGLPTRRARPESDVVHAVASRMILEKSGGQPTIDARVRDTAVPGFKQRDAQDRQDVAAQRGGSQGTERAVELGLDFLARHQSPDGSWSLHNFSAGRRGYEQAGVGSMQSDSAGTGLALLAFLGAGYTHTDGKYRLAVSRGLDFLIRNQKQDGDLFAGGSQYCWLYSHGIASIALCEAYGMTRDQVVEGPAQRAIDFIAAAQHPEEGGWRYSPGRDSDTSVSGWQLMALKSGELAGLKIPPECYPRIGHWLDGAASGNNPARYVYRPKATQQHQREVSLAMTAESLLMRQYLGWKRDNANLVAGADFLRANLPQLGTRTVPRRDAYYWYYATQVMFQMQGAHWKDWNDALRTLLVGSQLQAGPLSGSWDPGGPIVADRWGAAGGRIYVTAMHLLMLEVYYRHLPLYQTLE